MRYNGPKVSARTAEEIAGQFVHEKQLPAGAHVNTRHQKPVIYGRADDQHFGLWRVEFHSSVAPDPPNTATSPAPNSPIVIEVNDQTGTATLFQWL